MGPSTTSASIAAIVARNRARHFVGRQSQRQRFTAFLAPDSPWRVLFLHGPAGFGKSALLHQYQNLAEAAGLGVLVIDGRTAPRTPEGLRQMLRFYLGRGINDSIPMLVVDNFEQLAPLENWFRNELLPEMPERARLVLASRDAPARGWQDDPGWAPLVQIEELAPLADDEVAQYLCRRGFDGKQSASVTAFARGWPLVLALAADVQAHQPDADLSGMAGSRILAVLMAKLLHGIDVDQLQALRAAAIVREIDEPMLAHVLALPLTSVRYDWLAGLSFVQQGERGLILHALLRDAVTADLRGRDPCRYDLMVGRAYRFMLRRLALHPPAQCGPAVADAFYVQRDLPAVRNIYRFDEQPSCYCDAPAPDDWPHIRDMVRRHEGETAVRRLIYWRERQPQGLIVVRDATRQVAGFLFRLELNGRTPEDAADDPMVARYVTFLAGNDALAPGRHAILFYSWMAADTYQDLSAVQTQVNAYILYCLLATPDLAWLFFFQPDTEAWTRLAERCGRIRLPGPPVPKGQHRVALYAHDYRRQSPLQWMSGLHRVFRGGARAVAVTLDQAAFQGAVRDALRTYTEAQALARNPLVHCALVTEHPESGSQPPIEILRHMLRVHCEGLRGTAKTAPVYPVLERTYLKPARNHALAAAELHLSERTYARRLAKGLALVTAALWAQENGGFIA